MTDTAQDYSQTHPAKFSTPEPRYRFQVGVLPRWLQLLSVHQLRFGIFLAVFYLIPYLFMWLVQWDMAYRHVLAGLVFVSLAIFAAFRRHTWAETGFRADNLKPALLSFGIVTVFFTLVMWVLTYFHWIRLSAQPMPETWAFLYYIFVATPFQEFIYRGLLFAEMRRIGIRTLWVQALISGGLFSILHLHYRDWVNFLMTLMIGTIWAWLYARRPNWIAVTLSHGILGAIVILLRIL